MRASGATIYDIARVAGVNPSTVSRALNGQGRVGKATQERILAAAKELNYRFNPVARALPTGRTRMLGLVIADLTNPMFFDVLRGAERAAASRGYTLVIADSAESERVETDAVERIVSFVDGLVFVTTRLDDTQILEIAGRKSVTVINRVIPGIPSLIPDITPGIDEAIDHLADLGHRSIAYLSGPQRSWMTRARWQVIMASAMRRGMTVIEIAPNWHTQAAGEEALTRITAAGVSAVIAYNDLMAIGLLKAAQASGMTIPADLSIIGFDDIFGADFTNPPLSTIKVPLLLLGQRAVDRALDELGAAADVGGRDRDESLVTSLVIRGSTGSPAATGLAELALARRG